jgi:LAS superfamily LD-carboxypeptidase LdcB
MNEHELTGQSRAHIVDLDEPRCTLHYEAVCSFLAMCDAARHVGIDLQVRSGFRSFDTQVQIWNRKWRGERTLLGRDGTPLQHDSLSADELIEAILTWSALPGGSRHHWGSDLDLVDAAAIPPGYEVQLVPGEYSAQGIFARLNAWLDDHAGQFGFFRPYATDRGGVSPEPWHLSYAPISLPAQETLSLSTLRAVLENSALEGKAQVLSSLPEIYTRFMLNVDAPPK